MEKTLHHYTYSVYLIQERSKPLAFEGLRGMAILRPGVCAKYDSGLYQIKVSEVLPKPHLTNFGTNKPKQGTWEWYRAPCPTAPHVALKKISLIVL